MKISSKKNVFFLFVFWKWMKMNRNIETNRVEWEFMYIVYIRVEKQEEKL